MILLIDNYDSFSYNLYQLVGELEPDIRVVRNDQMGLLDIAALEPQAIILSPGPGRPADAGICEQLVRELGGAVPLLGVCLGHQAIVEACGGVVGYAHELMHGKTSRIRVDTETPLFKGLPAEITVGRYHSLAADATSLPSCLRVTATAPDGEVMAVQHKSAPVFGLQFHPESIMTPDGRAILANFLEVCE